MRLFRLFFEYVIGSLSLDVIFLVPYKLFRSLRLSLRFLAEDDFVEVLIPTYFPFIGVGVFSKLPESNVVISRMSQLSKWLQHAVVPYFFYFHSACIS